MRRFFKFLWRELWRTYALQIGIGSIAFDLSSLHCEGCQAGLVLVPIEGVENAHSKPFQGVGSIGHLAA